MDRSTLGRVSRQAQMTISRGTVREFEDNHLVQECKEIDVFHSETASNKGAPLERFQMVGMTAVPLKQQQQEGQQQQQSSQQASQDGTQWNHSQPQGPAAEALMLYLNGSRAHPVALVDDRRVRPYNMKEGEGAFYSPDGSEQMLFYNETGAYLVSLDGKSVKDKQNDKTRMASLRHVNKTLQTHKIQKQQAGQQAEQQQQVKHEGESVNTEVRCTKDRIEFRAGDTVVGYYEKSSEKWSFTGKNKVENFSEKMEATTPFMDDKVSSRHNLEDSAGSLVEGQGLDLSGKVYIKRESDDTNLMMQHQKITTLETQVAALEARIAALES